MFTVICKILLIFYTITSCYSSYKIFKNDMPDDLLDERYNFYNDTFKIFPLSSKKKVMAAYGYSIIHSIFYTLDWWLIFGLIIMFFPYNEYINIIVLSIFLLIVYQLWFIIYTNYQAINALLEAKSFLYYKRLINKARQIYRIIITLGAYFITFCLLISSLSLF